MKMSLSLRDVTFGITSFERPQLLKRLVHSILKVYPYANIVVADNGRRKAVLPNQVKVLDLPFDCGLSASRNALARAIETKLMLLLEEDFYFLPTTRIESLIDVLNHDSEVGVVGGAMLGPMGHVVSYSMDIEVFRETLFVRETNHRQCITRRGTSYRICDLIWNFALFRKQMLQDQPWDDELKVGEHTPYFHEVKKAARWRVACCPEAVIYHVPDRRSELYRTHRMRARDFFHGYLRRNGLSSYRRIARSQIDETLCDKPNIVILGVGHSGTSILAKMLHQAGWQACDADRRFGESVSIRRLNKLALQSGVLPAAARHWLQRFPQPWAVKDPRFVWTLHLWLRSFANLVRPPVLVRIRREPDAVVRSHQRRGVKGDLESMVREREEKCSWQYQRWPWTKTTVEYEKLGAAISLFKTQRMDTFQSVTAETEQQVFTFNPLDRSMEDSFEVEDSGRDYLAEDGYTRQLRQRDDLCDGSSLMEDGSGFIPEIGDGSTFAYDSGFLRACDDGSGLRDGSGFMDHDHH